MQTVCSALVTYGAGVNKHMTKHMLRAVMISKFMSSEHSVAVVILRSGHPDNYSLQSYHNLMGSSGEEQLRHIFGVWALVIFLEWHCCTPYSWHAYKACYWST